MASSRLTVTPGVTIAARRHPLIVFSHPKICQRGRW